MMMVLELLEQLVETLQQTLATLEEMTEGQKEEK